MKPLSFVPKWTAGKDLEKARGWPLSHRGLAKPRKKLATERDTMLESSLNVQGPRLHVQGTKTPSPGYHISKVTHPGAQGHMSETKATFK